MCSMKGDGSPGTGSISGGVHTLRATAPFSVKISEEPGMNACAEWLRKLVPEVKTSWIPVNDPYWRSV